MVSTIEGYLKTRESYFVVVGAGHLVGDNGIIKMLQGERLFRRAALIPIRLQAYSLVAATREESMERPGTPQEQLVPRRTARYASVGQASAPPGYPSRRLVVHLECKLV